MSAGPVCFETPAVGAERSADAEVVDLEAMEAEDRALAMPERTEAPLKLTLDQCVLLSLAHNYGLQVERYNPQLSGADVQIAESEFDPSLNLSGDTDAAFRGGSDEYSSSGTAYISRKFLSGADLRLNQDLGRSTAGTHTGTITLSATQPLLRNFGFDINRASIETAENNLAIAESRLVDAVIDTVAEVHLQYWALVLAVRNLEVRERALQQAKELLRENVIKFRLREALKTDVLEARARVASQRVSVVLSESAIIGAEDRLKAVTNIAGAPAAQLKQFTEMEGPSGAGTWQQPVLPLTDAPFIEAHPDEIESIREAIDSRPDYFQMKKTLENNDIALQFAKNQLYPQLDLSASVGLTGSGSETGPAVDEMATKGYSRWSLGMVFSYPLGNRSRRNSYRKRQFEKEQVLLNFKALEQTIILEVRGAVRNIETDVRRVKAARIALDSAEANLAAAVEVREAGVGRMTTRDILESQADLEDAGVSYLIAVVDYNRSLISLQRVKGTLLKSYSIEIERE